MAVSSNRGARSALLLELLELLLELLLLLLELLLLLLPLVLELLLPFSFALRRQINSASPSNGDCCLDSCPSTMFSMSIACRFMAAAALLIFSILYGK